MMTLTLVAKLWLVASGQSMPTLMMTLMTTNIITYVTDSDF